MISAEIDDTLYRISTAGGGITRYFCPVTVVRLTPKQIIVKTPRGNTQTYWRENGRQIGNPSVYLLKDKPAEGDYMRPSAEAMPIRPAPGRMVPVKGLPIARGREIVSEQMELIDSMVVQANGQVALMQGNIPVGMVIWPDLTKALTKETKK